MRSSTQRLGVSQRELQVLYLLSNGYSSKEAALALFISTHTIKDHRKALLKKLDARNVAQLVRKGFECQLIFSKTHKISQK